MHLTSNCNSYDHLVFFRTNWLLMLSYFIDHYKHKQNVIIGGSNASNRSTTSLTTTFHSSSQHAYLNFFYLIWVIVISEESKSEIARQAAWLLSLFWKEYPRASCQFGPILHGLSLSLLFLRYTSFLGLFSSSVSKFIPKFPKLLPPPTQGWTFPIFSPKRLRGNHWYCR